MIGSALRLALTLLALSILSIILAGITLADRPTAQAVVFGILGAILQAVFLGLVYEVWLRSEVEDATLEKLGTSRDVREHGLIRLDAEANIDWQTLLEGAKYLTIVSSRPESLIGRFDDLIIRSGRHGSLANVRVVVPDGSWDENVEWCERFNSAWAGGAPAGSFFAIRLAQEIACDLIATDTRSILLIRPLCSGPGIEALKLMEFRQRGTSGIGAWLARQGHQLMDLAPTLGYSPPEAVTSVQRPPGDEAVDEEHLT